jgi:dihydroorotate dehydrogenase electron transfer subunit
MVDAPGRPDCVLLRPYSYFLSPNDDSIALLVKEVGKGTRALLGAEPGTEVRVFGPLGNAFPEPQGECWIVAGGVGAAPWGRLLRLPRVSVLFGARTASETGFVDALRDVGAKVEMATDDGSAGYAGTVIDLLAQRLAAGPSPAVIYSCGPTPMMAAAARIARDNHLPCWVSLEERMGCGFGVCRGCAHRDAGGDWRCICEDGPVYEAAVIFGGAA